MEPIWHLFKLSLVKYHFSVCSRTTSLTLYGPRNIFIEVVWLEFAHGAILAITLTISSHALLAGFALKILDLGQVSYRRQAILWLTVRLTVAIYISPFVGERPLAISAT